MRLAQFSLYFFVVAFWLSSWIPVPLDMNTLVVLIGFVATIFVAAFATATRPALCHRMGRAFAWIALVFFVLGAVLATLVGALGTSAAWALAMIVVVGIAGFVGLISTVLRHSDTAKLRLGVGGTTLLALAVWSWASAFSMYSYRGIATATSNACILVPTKLFDYDTELSSVWQMRLTDFASDSTGPTGSTILNYHAILVSPDTTPNLYNWSKVWLRFEPLNSEKNAILPDKCPEQSR